MNLINPQKIEDLILKLLMKGELNTTSLLSHIREIRKDTTKQGFYAALRKLKAEEVILIYKGTVSLNTVWIKKMRDAFEILGRTYTTEQTSFDVLDLQDKESISYSFSTIKNLDIFWGHSQNILMHNTPNHEPIYAYDPHYWFYLARKDTESELLKEIVQNKRQFLMSVGNSAGLDKLIKPDFNNNYLQYNYAKMFEADNYYMTVIGNYITEVYLDENISEKIHQIYKSTRTDDKNAILLLKTFLEARARNRIKISRNKNKADKLKKKLGKNFYILKRDT